YFNSGFGFRDQLIEGLSKIKINFFNESSVPDKVVLGKNGWMFLWGEYYNIKQDYLRINLHTDEEIVSVFEVWDNRLKSLSEKGIAHYTALFHNQHSIYGENLPYRVRVQRKDTFSRAQQVMSFYKSHTSPLKILDVTPQLQKKKDSDIYYKHDSHW